MVFASGFPLAHCLIPGCEEPVHAKGLCRRHYDCRRNSGRAVRDRMSRACLACGVFFETERKDRLFCSHKCRTRWYRKRKRSEYPLDKVPTPLKRSRYRVERPRERLEVPVESFTVADVWAKSPSCCILCGRPLDRSLVPWDADAGVPDWIVPPEQGGGLTLENRIIVHRSCWSRKAQGVEDARNGRKVSVDHGGQRAEGQ